MLPPRFVVLATFLVTGPAVAQTIHAPFDQSYSFRSLGPVPGVPSNLGGLTFKHDDDDVLLIGGNANRAGGAIYAIRVTRDASGAITGFQGTATKHADAPYLDGGLQYGPNNVLFYTRYPQTEIGQIEVGSTAPDKVIQLGSVGWTGASPGALSFVPPGFPGAGQLKINAYVGGRWNSCTVAPDGQGTFDLVGMTSPFAISGGPEGLLYPPPGSPLLPDYARLLVCEYGSGSVVVYDLDQNGDPVPATRTVFMNGLGGAEGATIDAQSGAFLFSTFGSGNQVIVVDGFATCGSFVNYGSGIPNASGATPSLRGSGCATINRAINFQVGNGPASSAGALNIGLHKVDIPLFGGSILTTIDIPIAHSLDAQGAWTTTLDTPNDPALVGNHLYFQAAYFDVSAPFGITATYGLDMHVR